ncbi:MAG TPA: hypothetical protein DDY31_20110 [Lachnospiraceae bacterium]|nr:hypothetical protein [Lachnospiraceae bacterium]
MKKLSNFSKEDRLLLPSKDVENKRSYDSFSIRLLMNFDVIHLAELLIYEQQMNMYTHTSSITTDTFTP